MPYVENHSDFPRDEINPHIQEIVAEVLEHPQQDVIIFNYPAAWGETAAPITLRVETRKLPEGLTVPDGMSAVNFLAMRISHLMKDRFAKGGEPETLVEEKKEMGTHYPD